jgi:hypothetical protein
MTNMNNFHLNVRTGLLTLTSGLVIKSFKSHFLDDRRGLHVTHTMHNATICSSTTFPCVLVSSGVAIRDGMCICDSFGCSRWVIHVCWPECQLVQWRWIHLVCRRKRKVHHSILSPMWVEAEVSSDIIFAFSFF